MSENGKPPRPMFRVAVEAQFDNLNAALELADQLVEIVDGDDFILVRTEEIGVSVVLENVPESGL